MSARPETRRPPGVWAVVVARAGTALIDVCAFWLSATTLTDLARRAGIDPMQAWMWPVIVDGMIVVATVAIVALARHGRKATVYPWALLIAGALVSVTANCLHALVATDSDLPPVLSASVAAVPPLVLLAATHLTVQLGRHLTHTAPAPAPVDDAAVPVTTPEPQPPLVSAGRAARTVTAPRTEAVGRALTAATASGAPTPDAPTVTAPSVVESHGANEGEQPAAPVHGGRDSAGAASAGTPRAAAAVSDARDQAALLSEKGLSNRAIATRLGVHPSTVGRWLTAPVTTSPPVEPPAGAPSVLSAQATPAARLEPHGTDAPDSKEPQP